MFFTMVSIPISNFKRSANTMSKGGNKGAAIFCAILAVGSLGLSGYMFVEDRFLGGNEYVPEHEHEYNFTEGFRLVALWEDLDGNFTAPSSYFPIEFHNETILDTDYVSVFSETQFFLPLEGIYKITLNILLLDLSPSSFYILYLTRNGTQVGNFEAFETGSTLDSDHQYVSSTLYINGTGNLNDVYMIYALASANFWYSPKFQVTNQLAIEYFLG